MAEVSLKGIKRISSGNSDGLAKKGAGFSTSKLSKALLTVLILLALQGTFGIDGNIVSALSVKNEVVFTYMDELDVQKERKEEAAKEAAKAAQEEGGATDGEKKESTPDPKSTGSETKALMETGEQSASSD